MSRGLGRVERQILERLTPRRKGHVPRLMARELARALHVGHFDEPIPAGLRATVYQALASLERKGLIVRTDGRITSWALAEALRAQADQQREKAAKEAQRERARRRQQEKAAPPEPPQDRQPAKHPTDRLARLLGMLGSAHDGEALNAARAAEAERQRLGQTWAQLLNPADDLWLAFGLGRRR